MSTSGFFHESVSQRAPEYTVRAVLNFLKIRREIHSSRCTTGVVYIGGKRKKTSVIKILIILFGHLCFATGVIDIGGKFAASIIDTGGKFATGINNMRKTGGKISSRCC